MITKLTPYQKMQAISEAFYCGGVKWLPTKGDYYTTVRNDLELYQILDEDDENFYTIYCTDVQQRTSAWKKTEFLTHGFGPNRIQVRKYIIGLDPDFNNEGLKTPNNYLI